MLLHELWASLEGAANTCKGAPNSSLSHLGVILLLRQKASWTFRRGVIPFAFGTDPILIIPHFLRETDGAERPGLWGVLAGGGGAPKGELVLIGGRAGAAG